MLATILVLILGILLHRERTRNQTLEDLVKQLSELAEEQGTIAYILARNGGDITGNTGDTLQRLLSSTRGVTTSTADVRLLHTNSLKRMGMLMSELKTQLRQSIDAVNSECILAHDIRIKLQEHIISINLLLKYDTHNYESLDKAKGHIASAQMFLALKDYLQAKLHAEWINPNLEYTGRFPRTGILPESPEPAIIAHASTANMSERLD